MGPRPRRPRNLPTSSHALPDLPRISPDRRWALGRAALVALTAVASYAIPDMERMVSLTGALAFSTIGFVLPGAFFLRLRPPPLDGAPPRLADDAGAVAMIALGIVGGAWGVYTTLFGVR